jgi:hypothetical protein
VRAIFYRLSIQHLHSIHPSSSKVSPRPDIQPRCLLPASPDEVQHNIRLALPHHRLHLLLHTAMPICQSRHHRTSSMNHFFLQSSILRLICTIFPRPHRVSGLTGTRYFRQDRIVERVFLIWLHLYGLDLKRKRENTLQSHANYLP